MTSDTDMLAVVFQGEGVLEIKRRPVPAVIAPDDVVLRIGAVGICGSDLHILDVPPSHAAKPGVILGHEFAGEVVEIGSAVTTVRLGDHVAVDQNPPCGRCARCRDGAPNFCSVLFDNPHTDESGWPNTPGQWWDGGMAEYARVPAHYVYGVDRAVPMPHVVLAEPLGCVLNATDKVLPLAGESAVVIGAGPIGLLFIAVLRHMGLDRVVAIEPSAERREAATRVGATGVLNPTEGDTVTEVRDLLGGGADVVVEAVGSQLEVAVKVAADEARIVCLGVDSRARATIAPLEITSKELRIVGVFLMRNTMARALVLIESGVLPLDKIISHVLPLEDVHRGVELARRGRALKVIFTPPSA